MILFAGKRPPSINFPIRTAPPCRTWIYGSTIYLWSLCLKEILQAFFNLLITPSQITPTIGSTALYTSATLCFSKLLKFANLLLIHCHKLQRPLPQIFLLLFNITLNARLDLLHPLKILATHALDILTNRQPCQRRTRFLRAMYIGTHEETKQPDEVRQHLCEDEVHRHTRVSYEAGARHETRVEGRDGPLLARRGFGEVVM